MKKGLVFIACFAILFLGINFISAQTYQLRENVTLLEGSTAYVDIYGINHTFILDPFLGDKVGIIIDGTYSNTPIMLSKGEKYTFQQNPITFIEIKDIFVDTSNGEIGGVVFLIDNLDCSETDNGDDIYHYGTRTNINLNSASFGKPEGDYCILNPPIDNGVVISDRAKEVNSCEGENCYLIEYHCVRDLSDSFKAYQCPQNYNCSSGACRLKNETSDNITTIIINASETGKPIEVNQTLLNNPNVIIECSGCLLDTKCYPFGFRKEGKFCSDSENFTSQLESSKSCENNFECSSNVCVSGKCISEGFIQKILNWFGRLFGAS